MNKWKKVKKLDIAITCYGDPNRFIPNYPKKKKK